MDALRIEARNQCKGCGLPVPFNAYVEQTTCGSCSRVVPFGVDDWTSMLGKPFKIGHDMPAGETKTVTLIGGGVTIALDYTHEDACCTKCKSALPSEVEQFASRGWVICPACGNRLSVRAVPASLAWSGATLLIGEDVAQVTGAPATAPVVAQAVVLQCPQCHAPLSVDGSNRMVKCQYCSVDVYLPDDLWQRLHPVKQVARWYVCLGNRPEAQVAQFVWYSMENSAVDGNKNTYAGGEDDDSKRVVWSMGPDFKLRWVRADLDMIGDLRIALDVQNRRVIAWSMNKHSGVLLAMADGSTLGTIGGIEPDNAHVHHFDLDRCKALVGDLDGSMLALMGDRLLRYDVQGNGVATWPPHKGMFGAKAEKLESLFVMYAGQRQPRRVEDVSIEQVGNQPVVLDDHANIAVGWDGRLYAEYNEWVAAFDRTGKRLYRLKLALDGIDDQIGADAQGALYVRGHVNGNPEQRMVMRVAPDGSRADVIATDRRRGGVVGSENMLVVAPDGTLYLFRHGMRIRVLAPDGRLLWQSDASKAGDVEEDQDAARRA